MPIPWTELSKTFQDAIQVARSLNLEYLWIDTLRIIQDDEMDWVRESKEMCNIYENSHLTIVAISARNALEGLFLKEKRRVKTFGTTSGGSIVQLSASRTRIPEKVTVSDIFKNKIP